MSTRKATSAHEVVHLGPTLAEPGGMASVISEYVAGDLSPWSARPIAVYAKGSCVRRLALLLKASYRVLCLSRRRTAGVHLHVSQNFDLVRGLLLVFLARLRRLRVVATIHGSSFVSSANEHPHVASRLMRSVTIVTALNDETLATARALGAPDVISLPNPMSVQPRPRRQREMNTVVFAGEVGRRKGVDTLLAAWPLVHADHPHACLRLIGPVADATLVEQLPTGALVEGPQPRAYVRAALETATVAVLPSRAEALPMFVLEAMAAGIPVVATPVGAVADAVEDAGIIVPVDDHSSLAAAIADLLANPRRASELGHRGTTKARDKYGAAAVLLRFAQLYSVAFGPSGPRAEVGA